MQFEEVMQLPAFRDGQARARRTTWIDEAWVALISGGFLPGEDSTHFLVRHASDSRPALNIIPGAQILVYRDPEAFMIVQYDPSPEDLDADDWTVL